MPGGQQRDSVKRTIRGILTHFIQTGIETKFLSERPIDHFSIFLVHLQESFNVCFGVLKFSHGPKVCQSPHTSCSALPASLTAPGAGKTFRTASFPAFLTCSSNLARRGSRPLLTRTSRPYILARSVGQPNSRDHLKRTHLPYDPGPARVGIRR